MLNFHCQVVKGAAKLYFMYYSHVLLSFSPGLYKSSFFTYSFRKTTFSSFYVSVFRGSVYLTFNLKFCSMFEFNVLLKALIKLHYQGIESIDSVKIAPRKLPAPQEIATYENCPLWKFPPLKIAPLKIAPRKLTPRKFSPMKVATIVVRNWKLLPCSGGHGFRGRADTYLIWQE